MNEHEEYLEATRRGEEMLATIPHAVSAHYDRRIGRVIVRLSTGLDIMFSPKDAQELETATWKQLQNIVVEPPGFDLYFPEIDAGLYIPSLLEGFFGSKKWMAARLGAQGGKAKSAAKAQASRENGRMGGRPKKVATAA